MNLEMKNYTLSVILTVYNLEDCLEETLRSLANQSYKPLEVIIIDDGSVDRSIEIINEFLERHGNWKVWRTKNLGVACARNLGLSHSKGDYILFLDGDDLFREDFLLKVMRATNNKPDVVVCRAREYDHITGLTTSLSWGVNNKFIPPNAKSFSPRELSGSIFYSFMGWSWDKVFRREHVNNHKLYFPNFKNSEDLAFVYPAVYLAEKINIVDEELVLHRINRKKSISNNIQKHPFSILKALDFSLRTLKEHPSVYTREIKCFEEWALDLLLWGWRQIAEEDIESKEQYLQFYLDWFPPSFREKKRSEFFPFVFKRVNNFSSGKYSRWIENFYYFLALCSKNGFKRIVFRVVVQFKTKL